MKPIDEMSWEELITKRKAVIAEAKGILDKADAERRDLTPAEGEKYNELDRQIDELNDAIRFIERQRILFDTVPTEENGAVRMLKPEERFSDVVTSPLPDGIQPYEISMGRTVRGIITGQWEGADAERRALGSYDNTLGGYLLPAPLSNRIIDLSRNQAAVSLAGAITVPMETKELTLARIDSDPTAYWRAENTAITASDMTFGSVKLVTKTLGALIKVSAELVEDAPNLGQQVENALAQALGLELDRVALYGDGGDSEPLGIFNTAGVQAKDLASAAPSNYDFVSEAVQLIENENGTPGALLFSPATKGKLDRLKDTTNQPLQAPESFTRLRKFTTKQVSDTDAFLGNFNMLLIGIRKGVTLEASRQTSDAFEKHQVWIKATLRADIALMKPKHFVKIINIG